MFMSKFTHQLNKVLTMLQSIEDEINLAGYSLTEKKVFFTISQISEIQDSCNISDVINDSGLSRSSSMFSSADSTVFFLQTF